MLDRNDRGRSPGLGDEDPPSINLLAEHLDLDTNQAIMAKNGQNPDAEVRPGPRMRKHLKALDLASVREYFAWCLDKGFAPSLDKSKKELADESDVLEREETRRNRHTKIHRNPRKFIEDCCAGRLVPEDVTRPNWHEVCRSIHESSPDLEARKNLRQLLLTVDERAGFLFESTAFAAQPYRYVDALLRLNDRRGQWLRPLEAWRPASHNVQRQFSSLVRHLLTRYPVPYFMDSAWFRRERGSYRLRDWFLHIGAGKNIRTAKTPLPLTKRMAHHFAEAPQHYSIEQALRWGQVHALGGDQRLTEAFLGTPIAVSFEHDAFWQTVLRFFIANPLLDRKQVGPIVDFLLHQKFEAREVVIGPGEVELQDPPQPNLTMRGRTPESLLRQVEDWHRELGRTTAAEGVYFRRSGFKAFEKKAGRNGEITWHIRELLSGAELVAEGRALQHCVASYAGSCASGECSIWTMVEETPTRAIKHQTVEVSAHGMIVESRGRQNRLPTAAEYKVLQDWARKAGLSISNFVQVEF